MITYNTKLVYLVFYGNLMLYLILNVFYSQPKEFWEGKRIIEMKKERPQWFSKNLLQKTTQQPSNSTDVKPTDLA